MPQFLNLKSRNPHMKVFQLIAVFVLITAEEVEGQITTLARVCLENSDPAIASFCLVPALPHGRFMIPDKSQAQSPPPTSGKDITHLMKLLRVKWGNAFKKDFLTVKYYKHAQNSDVTH